MSRTQKIENLDERSENLRMELRSKFEKLKNNKLLIVLFSDTNIYPLVKQEAELNVGCLTQCLQTKTIDRDHIAPNLSTLLLKINAKLNGTNFILAKKPLCLSGNVMFMGADMTHCTLGREDKVNFSAVTASHDLEFFKYNMISQIQLSAPGYITGFGEIALRQLKIYIKETKEKPDHIIYFRDGVWGDQFEEVISQEVEKLKEACTGFANYRPKITCIIVMTRRRTVFFPTNADDTYDKHYNAPVGTCMDTGFTHPLEMNLKDFYLASHTPPQGVTKPTRYYTIYDDAELTHDDIEELTFHLCYMYTRSTRPVSYPAPTYYAHLALERAKALCDVKEIDWERLNVEQRIEISIKNVETMRMHYI